MRKLCVILFPALVLISCGDFGTTTRRSKTGNNNLYGSSPVQSSNGNNYINPFLIDPDSLNANPVDNNNNQAADVNNQTPNTNNLTLDGSQYTTDDGSVYNAWPKNEFSEILNNDANYNSNPLDIKYLILKPIGCPSHPDQAIADSQLISCSEDSCNPSEYWNYCGFNESEHGRLIYIPFTDQGIDLSIPIEQSTFPKYDFTAKRPNLFLESDDMSEANESQTFLGSKNPFYSTSPELKLNLFNNIHSSATSRNIQHKSKQELLDQLNNFLIPLYKEDLLGRVKIDPFVDNENYIEISKDMGSLQSNWLKDDMFRKNIKPGYMNLFHHILPPTQTSFYYKDSSIKQNSLVFSGTFTHGYLSHYNLNVLNRFLAQNIGVNKTICENIINYNLNLSTSCSESSHSLNQEYSSIIDSTFDESDFSYPLIRKGTLDSQNNIIYSEISGAEYKQHIYNSFINYSNTSSTLASTYSTSYLASANKYKSNFEDKIIHVLEDWVRAQMWIRSFTDSE